MTRALTHPSLSSVTVAGILHALSDPVRLGIVRELLASEDGLSCTQASARLEQPTPKSTCSLHYRVLREAGLIVSERRGTEMVSRVRSAELQARFPGLLQSILAAYERETLPQDLPAAEAPGQRRARSGTRVAEDN